MLLNIIISTSLISIFSLLGLLTLSLKEDLLKKIILILVSLSAGTLLGGAFFHLIPEAMAELDSNIAMGFTLFGFSFFFVLEKILHYGHCHKNGCTDDHIIGYINLFADGFHNIIDGLVISAAFLTNPFLGIVTTFAMVLHEIPQEIGDYGLLIHSGMEKNKALSLNFVVATFVVIGGIIGFYLSGIVDSFTLYLLPFTAGGFIYISACDLIPEIHKEHNIKKWITNFTVFLIGAMIMVSLTLLEVE